MVGYYVNLALRSLRRNTVLTALMVLTLGLGIGASITTLAVLKLLSGNPLPQTGARTVTMTFDPSSDQDATPPNSMPRWWGNLLSYRDAMALLDAHKGVHQAAVAVAEVKLAPQRADARPFHANAVLTTPDFFTMFGATFGYGAPWRAADGNARARVAVISARLNGRLFGGGDSVGKTLRMNDHDYRIVGVLEPWSLQPRVYGVSVGAKRYGLYGPSEGVFVPLQTAAAEPFDPGQMSCWAEADTPQLQTAPCVWLSLWVELAQASDAASYKAFLRHYVNKQIALGRTHDPKVWLYDVESFLDWQQVVPADIGLRTHLAFAFLLICIVNTVGLLLAKCLRRSREIGVRRALGATRRAIFAQFIVEAGMVGLAGGVLGLILAELGLLVVRHQPVHYAALAHLDARMLVATFALAVASSLVAGLLPAWRACAVAPAPQLKSA